MNSLAYGAVWIFVFTLPWERMLMLNQINIVTRLTGVVAMAGVLAMVVVSGRLRRWHFFHVAALVFWLWAALGLLRSALAIPDKFWTYAQLLLVLWMIWELAPSAQRQRGLLVAYILGAYVSALDTLYLSRTEAGLVRRFATGGADPNDLAMRLALALPIAWYIGMTADRPLLRWISRGYIPIAVVAIGLTGSRGGLLACTMALLIVPLSLTKLSPGRMAVAVALLGVAGAVAIAYIPETLIQRLATTSAELQGGRLGGRGRIWLAGLEAFTHKPVFGYGTGGFVSAITPMLGSAALVAHNSFLSVLVEQGIVGLLLYLMMLLAVFHSVLALRGLDRRFALVLLATLGTAMLPLTWEHNKVPWFMMAILLGFSQTRAARVRAAQQPAVGGTGPASPRARAGWRAGRPAALGRAPGGATS